ncbi:putative isochorismatase family hydrolase [Halenospora varia]|nr:putative isochorismatase family hydrolase [Halenospora varia]
MYGDFNMADHSHTAFILVDNQVGAFDPNFWGSQRSNPAYFENVRTLLSAFRSFPPGSKAPLVIHVYHKSINPLSPLHSTSPAKAFHPSSIPLDSEPVIGKSTNSAFIDSELLDLLKSTKIRKIYFAGLSLNWCLGNTIRHAGDLGVVDWENDKGEKVKGDIVVVDDAVAAWAKSDSKYDAETVHGVHIESLRGNLRGL